MANDRIQISGLSAQTSALDTDYLVLHRTNTQNGNIDYKISVEDFNESSTTTAAGYAEAAAASASSASDSASTATYKAADALSSYQAAYDSAISAQNAATRAENAAGAAERSKTSANDFAVAAANFKLDASTSEFNAARSADRAEAYENSAASAMAEAHDYAEYAREQSMFWTQQAYNNSTVSEAYAKGTKAGTPVESDDPAYHNNAKYWSEQAQSLGQAEVQNAEAYARGTRNGSDVSSSDPTYHNNSKYYSEQAAASASAAATYTAKAPYIGTNGHWYVWDATNNQYVDTNINATGPAGNGIASVAKTGSSGKVDYYTITFTDGTTFPYTVTNGQDGQGSGDMLMTDYDQDQAVYNAGGIPAYVTSATNGKAEKVSNPTSGNFAGLDSNGNLTDSGSKASDFLTAHQDITGKADKVSNAVSGNFAGLDSNGNLIDSGSKSSDFLTSHQDITGKADKVTNATNGNFAGLDSNGNITDSGSASSDFAAANHTHTWGDVTNKPFSTVGAGLSVTNDEISADVKSVSIATSGTASSTGAKKQQITINGTATDVGNSFYMQQSATLSTSGTTTKTFTNSGITTNSRIDPYVSDYSIVPTNVVASNGSCTVTLPKVSSAVSITVGIEVKN